MNFLEYMRNKAFWVSDYFRGSKIKKALDILYKCEGGDWDEGEIQTYQQNQINKLLAHAKKTVPYYYKMEDFNLEKWPVVDKNILRKEKNNVISTQFEKKDLIKMSTSGSTGTPFVCWQDIEKKRHVNAEVLYYNGKVGYSVGRRIIYLRSIVDENRKSCWQEFSQNIYLLDCKDLSNSGIRKMLSFIVRYSKNYGAILQGYASTFTAFKKYFEEYGTDEVKDANIIGIVSGSEILYDSTRKSMEEVFKCKCVSRYSNEENGFLGQDDEEYNTFYMNQANYYIEILKFNSDEPAAENEIGRIVVTDLYNYAMPMIRYDTGDCAAYTFKEYNNRKRIAVKSFSGRAVDMVTDCNGRYISPHVITNLMRRYSDIQQFKFIQKSMRDYKLLLNIDNEVVLDETRLIKDYKNILGEDSNIEVEHCDEIPVLSSGKRRYIVNEYKEYNN